MIEVTKALFVAHPEVIDCDLAGERALLHMDTNTYFTLNPVATDLWSALDRPRSVDDLVKAILAEYDVTEERCRADIETILAEMEKAGVITRTAGNSEG